MQARSTKRIRVRVRVRTAFFAMSVALIAGLLPAPAALAATGAQSHRVTQSGRSALNYWTDARLENAESADVDLSQDSGLQLGSSGGTGTETGTPQTFEGTTDAGDRLERATEAGGVPTEGRIFFTGSDGYDYSCSGTAVASANESTVWTAGHCVHDGAGTQYHSNWIFIPGYDNGDAPYGVWTAEWLSTTNAWANYSSFKYDVGAAVVGTNDGQTLGDTVGMEGIAFNQNARQNWTSLGYPAAGRFDGETLFACNSDLIGRHNPDYFKGKRTLYIDCNMTGGSSGGGWFFTSSDGYRYLNSVNSYGLMGHPNLMFGPYMGRAALTLYNSMESV